MTANNRYPKSSARFRLCTKMLVQGTGHNSKKIENELTLHDGKNIGLGPKNWCSLQLFRARGARHFQTGCQATKDESKDFPAVEQARGTCETVATEGIDCMVVTNDGATIEEAVGSSVPTSSVTQSSSNSSLPVRATPLAEGEFSGIQSSMWAPQRPWE